jgi:hypothetical protein
MARQWSVALRLDQRTISAELAKAGHTTVTGKPFAATAVKLMLAP